MTITTVSSRSRVTDHRRDDTETFTPIRGAMATTFIRRWRPLRAGFRTRAGAYGIIGVLLVSRGHGHVWREGFLIGFICFDVF